MAADYVWTGMCWRDVRKHVGGARRRGGAVSGEWEGGGGTIAISDNAIHLLNTYRTRQDLCHTGGGTNSVVSSSSVKQHGDDRGSVGGGEGAHTTAGGGRRGR